MTKKMIYFFLIILVTIKTSTSEATVTILHDLVQETPVIKEKPSWAFQKHYFSEQEKNGIENGFILFKNADFGPFGASEMSLCIKNTTDLKSLKDLVSIRYDNTSFAPAELRFKDIYSARPYSADVNCLVYELTSPEDVHDVYIAIPSNVNSSDLSFVRFFAANPTPGQWYFLRVKASGKALTICSDKDLYAACTFGLHSLSTQMFMFEKVSEDGFKIVSKIDDKVLAVSDGSEDNQTRVLAERFKGMRHQVWFIEPFDDGFRFRPKHYVSKCLDLSGGRNADGAIIVSHDCYRTDGQIWYVTKASKGNRSCQCL